MQHAHSRSPRLVALLDGRVVGRIYRDARSKLEFVYEESWRAAEESYPLSLSMPLTTPQHDHKEIGAYLWGLLPDSERTLDRYARTFGVSARSPVALLAHIGADCAGAVQLVPPERLQEFEGRQEDVQVDWIDTEEVANELRSAKETGLPGKDRSTVGRFSLAGAQPKIALFHREGRWGKPLGRTPTTHILKPPSMEYAGFAENEHLCLALASELGLSAAKSAVRSFDGEVAVVVERFDRLKTEQGIRRVHQEDVCQALSVLPWAKYENEGGPGVADVIAILQESSLEPEVDIGRFLDIMVLNWVLAATDAHAKNYALLHVPGGGVRLAPFYDIASFLPYADRRLYEVKMAMRIGREYLVRRIRGSDWQALAKAARVEPAMVEARLEAILARIPSATMQVAERCTSEGLAREAIEPLAARILERALECREQLSQFSPKS